MGDLSRNFSASEFRCKCTGTHGPHAPIDKELVSVLQRLRDRAGRPVPIVSGIRCAPHNRHVGGATNSEHLHGRGADIPQGICRVEEARAAGARGIGHRNGWVVHVDVRPGAVVIFDD